MTTSQQFVLGVDLDGVCADFYGKMREVWAEWRGSPVEELDPNVTYGFPEYGALPDEYQRVHRFAVTQRGLFSDVPVIPGAPQVLRRLSTEGVRIRIITHRLFIPYFHETAVTQTVRWLDHHSIPYWDLCFMADKALVNADLYIEDTPSNISRLEDDGRAVIAFTNSTNVTMDREPLLRAGSWTEAEGLIRTRYYAWRNDLGLAMPEAPGHAPPAHDGEKQ